MFYPKTMKKLTLITAIISIGTVALLLSCNRTKEMTLEDLEGFQAGGVSDILAKAKFRPFPGYATAYGPGVQGGTWNSAMTTEPKTFNALVAEGDNSSAQIQYELREFLANYDWVEREWVPNVASWEIITDEAADTLDIIYTIKEGVYWTYYNSDRRIPLTSDDFVYWHNDVQGDPKYQSSSYSGQFVPLPDGTQQQRKAYRIDDRRFRIHFPRIVANPVFNTNMMPVPWHEYGEAARSGDVEALRDLFNIATDPRLLPSIGRSLLVEYSQGQRLLWVRNPQYFDRDINGLPIEYPDTRIWHILPDANTNFLMFQNGDIEAYAARSEDVDTLVNNENSTWTVYHNDGAQGSNSIWSFNQNPQNADEPFQQWFVKTEFRQAMSSMFNRSRIISQVNRGLAQPMLWWFPPSNQFYNPNLRLQWTYDKDRALQLLSSIGINRDSQGVMRDWEGREVAFDLSFPSGQGTWDDMAAIITDELGSIGITVRPLPTDFQRLVDQLFETFDWQSVMIGITGGPTFPTQGTNVWLSNGNLHLWHPFQKDETRTEWEARKDFLFREGMFTYDVEKARPIWDEFQEILLREVPLIWMGRLHGFFAVQNRWDQSNVYYDNVRASDTTHAFLSK